MGDMEISISILQKIYGRWGIVFLIVGVLAVLALTGCTALPTANDLGLSPGANSSLRELSFFPMQTPSGGIDRYQSYIGGGSLFFSPAEILLAFAGAGPDEGISQPGGEVSLVPVRLVFVNANPVGDLDGYAPVSHPTNVLLGSDPDRWQVGIPSYTGLRYSNLYPGIDLTVDGYGALTGEGLQLKGTYYIAAGHDPALISWRYEGADRVSLEPNGDLRVEIPGQSGSGEQPGQSFRELTPVAWQIINGRPVEVAAAYRLADDGLVQFQLGKYDPAHPLVIDPTIEYGTFLGGAGPEEAVGIAVDGARSAIVVGSTVSVDYPLKIPLPEELIGTRNVFVTKLSRNGSQLDFSTIIGGTGDDSAAAVVVDSAGDIYLTGTTFSPDFPVLQNGQVPGEDSTGNIFILKLSLSGGTIRYSTIYGGTGIDEANDLAVDSGGSAFVGGFTTSEDFPLASPIQAFLGGGEGDGFVLRLNASGNELLYSSYLGGSAFDTVQAIDVDRQGSAYITGQTDSIDFPMVQAMQSELGGLRDTFITKINPDMNGYEYSTYEGFGISSVGNDLLVDDDGNAYVVGTMERTEAEGRGGSDVFVLRLKEDGSGLDINIVLGGDGDDIGLGIGLDKVGNVYVTGSTESTDLESAGTFQPGYGGDGDAFLAQLNAAGELVTYNYIGGSNFDSANAIEVISSGDAVLAGVTFSVDFPLTNAYQQVNRGDGDVFVLKIEDAEFIPTPVPTPTPEATAPPPTATPIPTALESMVDSDLFLYGLFGLMGFIFLLLVIEVVRSGRRRR
jgi:hypothetical protein